MLRKIVPFALSGALALGLAIPAALAQNNTAASTTTGQSTTSTHRRHHRRMSPNRQLRMLTKRLDLTTDQQSQIKPLLVSRQQQMRALWKDQSLSRQDKSQKMKDIQQDTSAKIGAVLNSSQKEKFEAMQEKMRQRRHQRMEQHQQTGGQSSPQM